MSLTSEHYERVRELMVKAGQTVRDKPEIPSLDERRLRAKLILEEALETVDALGLEVQKDGNRLEVGRLDFFEDGLPSLPGIVDGCADIIVVTTGTLIACGVHDNALLREVDLNNLGKFAPGGYRREDGKWIKPPGHKPPDIAKLLSEQPTLVR